MTAGDLNTRTKNTPVLKIIVNNGEIAENQNWKRLRDYCATNDSKVTNTFFRRKTHKYT